MYRLLVAPVRLGHHRLDQADEGCLGGVTCRLLILHEARYLGAHGPRRLIDAPLRLEPFSPLRCHRIGCLTERPSDSFEAVAKTKQKNHIKTMSV